MSRNFQVVSLLILAGFFWLMGAKIRSQAAELLETLPTPKTIEKVRETMNTTEAGKEAMNTILPKTVRLELQSLLVRSLNQHSLFLAICMLFSSLVFFISISPSLYIRGWICKKK